MSVDTSINTVQDLIDALRDAIDANVITPQTEVSVVRRLYGDYPAWYWETSIPGLMFANDFDKHKHKPQDNILYIPVTSEIEAVGADFEIEKVFKRNGWDNW